MSTKGWNSLKPITTPDQMSAPIHWNPMNEDWKMRLAKSQIYNTSSGFDTQTLDAMKKLHDKILTFGGDEVCMTMFDEDAPKILERGRFFLWQQLYEERPGLPVPLQFCTALV